MIPFKSINDFNGKLKDNILLTTTELKSNEDIKDTTSLTAQQKINELSITKTLIQAQDEILKGQENSLNTQEKELQLIVKTLDDNGKLSTEEIYRRLDNMDISVIETYLREKKLKKLKEQIKK